MERLASLDNRTGESRVALAQMLETIACYPVQAAALLDMLDGKQYSQIAESSGVQVGTVKSRISRLRQLLERWDDGFIERPGPPDPEILKRLRIYFDAAAAESSVVKITFVTHEEKRFSPDIPEKAMAARPAYSDLGIMQPMPFSTFLSQVTWDALKHLADQKSVLPLEMPDSPNGRQYRFLAPVSLVEAWIKEKGIRFSSVRLSDLKNPEVLSGIDAQNRVSLLRSSYVGNGGIVSLSQPVFEDIFGHSYIECAARQEDHPLLREESGVSKSPEHDPQASYVEKNSSVKRRPGHENGVTLPSRAAHFNGLTLPEVAGTLAIVPSVSFTDYMHMTAKLWQDAIQGHHAIPIEVKRKGPGARTTAGVMVPLNACQAWLSFRSDLSVQQDAALSCLANPAFPQSNEIYSLPVAKNVFYVLMSLKLFNSFRRDAKIDVSGEDNLHPIAASIPMAAVTRGKSASTAEAKDDSVSLEESPEDVRLTYSQFKYTTWEDLSEMNDREKIVCVQVPNSNAAAGYLLNMRAAGRWVAGHLYMARISFDHLKKGKRLKQLSGTEDTFLVQPPRGAGRSWVFMAPQAFAVFRNDAMPDNEAGTLEAKPEVQQSINATRDSHEQGPFSGIVLDNAFKQAAHPDSQAREPLEASSAEERETTLTASVERFPSGGLAGTLADKAKPNGTKPSALCFD